MGASDLSDEVRQFLREHIQTVGALDTLLLLQRNSTRAWSLDDIARELRTSPLGVAGFIREFITNGLVEEEGAQYKYHPANSKLEAAVHSLSRDYSIRPVAVVNAIYSTPDDKIQTFADAFKFKKG
ncbi:MAG: hypothetical protein V4642_05895 [Bacteroidota bacterium]